MCWHAVASSFCSPGFKTKETHKVMHTLILQKSTSPCDGISTCLGGDKLCLTHAHSQFVKLKASIAVGLTVRLYLCVGIIKILYNSLTMVYKNIQSYYYPKNEDGGFSKSAGQRRDNIAFGRSTR